jgi:predicted amino acid dehydrogenase
MTVFGHIVHPIDKYDLARRRPFSAFARLPGSWIDHFSGVFPPVPVARVGPIQSETGGAASGCIIACPLTARRLLQLGERAYDKVIASCVAAHKMGAQIVALGAFTSVIGDAGQTIAAELDQRQIPVHVTTGNSYAVGLAVQTLRYAAQEVGLALADATVAVFGATGSIGQACARLLAPEAGQLILVGRGQRAERLHELAEALDHHGQTTVAFAESLDFMRAVDVALFATSATQPLIHGGNSDLLRHGSLLCDLSLPRAVAPAVVHQRPDVLVIDVDKVMLPGGAVARYQPHFSFGFAPHLVYGCMAEAIILALAARHEHFTIGREIDLERVRTIIALGEQHGFRQQQLYAYDRPIPEERLHTLRRYR